MAKKRVSFSTENKMTTTVEKIFYTNEEIVAQSNIKMFGEIVKILVIEVDQ